MPLLLAGTLWLSLLLRGALDGSRNARVGGLAFALSLALLLFATAWSSVDERFPRRRSATSFPAATRRARPSTASGICRRLTAARRRASACSSATCPGIARALTLIWPDLETEILIRSGRAHRCR